MATTPEPPLCIGLSGAAVLGRGEEAAPRGAGGGGNGGGEVGDLYRVTQRQNQVLAPKRALFASYHAASKTRFFFFNLFYLFIYLFLAALGLRCCAWAFSSCGERGLLFFVVGRLLIVVASLVAEHGL